MSKYVSRVLLALSLVSMPVIARAQDAAQAQTPPAAQTTGEIRMADLVMQTTAPAVPPGTGPLAPLTLEDAVARALERNIDIAVVRLTPRIRDWDLAAQRASFLPTVSGRVGPAASTQLPRSTIEGGRLITNDTLTYNAGVTQAMPRWGGTFAGSFNNQRLETSNAFATRDPSYDSRFNLSFTQPVLRNFKTDNVRSQIRILQINRDVTDLQVQSTIENTLANVRNAYWELVFAIRAIDVAQRSLALSQKLGEDNRIRVEIGTMAPIDIIQAEVQIASAAQALTIAEATWRTAELNLKRLIVAGTADELWRSRLQPVDEPTVTPQPIDIDAAVARALAHRIDLQQDRKTLQTNDISMALMRNQTLPQVDLQASYGLTALGGTEFIRQGSGVDSVVVREIPGGYTQALRQLAGFDFPNWSVAAIVSYPIGTTAAKARHASAQIQYEQTQAQVRARELQVATEVTNAALSVESALKRLEAARLTRGLAEKQLEAEASKFEVGMSTNYQIVQFQRDLANARNSELRAILDYQRALVEFERVQSVGGTTTSISTIR